jgi:hypothetical protein
MDFAASAVERDSLAEVQTRPEFHKFEQPAPMGDRLSRRSI